MSQIPNENYNNQMYNNQQPPYGGATPQQNVNITGNITTESNFLSKLSLVLSILSFLCCCIDWLFAIPAVICAIIALIRNKKDHTAIAALVIASISLVFYIFAIFTGVLDSLSESVTGSSGKTENKRDSVVVENGSNTGKSSSNTEKKEVNYEIIDTQFYTYTNSIGKGKYLFIMEIKNTGNCNLYLDKCTIDLEDKDGE